MTGNDKHTEYEVAVSIKIFFYFLVLQQQFHTLRRNGKRNKKSYKEKSTEKRSKLTIFQVFCCCCCISILYNCKFLSLSFALVPFHSFSLKALYIPIIHLYVFRKKKLPVKSRAQNIICIVYVCWCICVCALCIRLNYCFNSSNNNRIRVDLLSDLRLHNHTLLLSN